MQPDHDFSNHERRRAERKLWRSALLISLLGHLLVFFLWRADSVMVSPFSAAGPRANDDLAAEGGMQAMNVRTPPPIPVTPPPVPLPTLDPVEIEEFDDQLQLDPSEVVGDAPDPLDAPGIANGRGAGDGGNAEEGLFSVVPPYPRGMIIPPTSSKLKGKEVEVWVWVNDQGRVVPDSTRLRPPTEDRGFNEQIVKEAADWVFQPATKGGQPVASWFPYKISM